MTGCRVTLRNTAESCAVEAGSRAVFHFKTNSIIVAMPAMPQDFLPAARDVEQQDSKKQRRNHSDNWEISFRYLTVHITHIKYSTSIIDSDKGD